jgi:probable HAF family extracellular repeat protein
MFPHARAAAAVVCSGLCAFLISPTAQPQSNYLIPLPQKGTVIAVNNNGQVLYDTGLLTGTTFAAFPAGFSVPTGSPAILGEDGVVAGATTTGHLAIYDAGTVTDLGSPPVQGQTVVTPTAINAGGQIAGTADWYSFIYSAGVFNSINITDATLVPPPPAPVGINDSGQIALSGLAMGVPCVGFLITGAVLTDLGPDCPHAINASGQITGYDYSTDPSGQIVHAFIWANGKLTLLPEPPPFVESGGIAINKGAQVVGGLFSAQSSVPFFYNGVMTDINSLVSASDPLKSSVTIGSVVDINDNRMLLLISTTPLVGASTAYLLQAPWLDVAPGPLSFASQAVGTTSPPQTLTLTNSGTVPLPLDSISIAPGTADFSQTNACPPSLAAGANCMVSVTVAPRVAGAQNAVLDVVTAGATIAVPLAARVPITITLSASPASPTAGQPFTITWTATTGSTCQSSGGKPNDGWSATGTSGSVSVNETAPGPYTYTLTCTAGSTSTVQSLDVTVSDPPSSGGGGVMDVLGLFVLCGLVFRRAVDRGGTLEALRSRQVAGR